MNIAQVVCVYPPYKGGIGTSAIETAKILHSLGHKVTTFTPDYHKDNKQGQDSLQENNQTIYLKSWLKHGNGAFLPQLLWRLKKYDVIYLHYPFFGGAEVVWLYKIFHKKIKLIIHFHHDAVSKGSLAKILGIPDKVIRRSLFEKADKIVSASLDYVKDSEIKNLFTKYQKKFQEIPFSVDTKNFYPAKEKNNKTPKIVFVGGLDEAHYFKGINVLLEAVSRLSDNNWKLSIVGDGNLRTNYEKKAANLNIDQRTYFLGRLDDDALKIAYRESDIFVLPSINKGEAFGIVLLEAIASGLPVITTDLAGVRSVFQNLREGLLIKPNDVNALQSAISQLLKNTKQRQEMGKAGRKLAKQKYSQIVITKKYKNLLSSI